MPLASSYANSFELYCFGFFNENLLNFHLQLFGTSWKETLEAYAQQQITPGQPPEPVCQATAAASESDKQVDDAVEEG